MAKFFKKLPMFTVNFEPSYMIKNKDFESSFFAINSLYMIVQRLNCWFEQSGSVIWGLKFKIAAGETRVWFL